jgi:hypothetical protein
MFLGRKKRIIHILKGNVFRPQEAYGKNVVIIKPEEER